MSILLFVGINVCMESKKINLKFLNWGQISKKWLLSFNVPLQFGQLVLLDKKSLNKCAFRLLASFLNWQWIMLNFLIAKLQCALVISQLFFQWSGFVCSFSFIMNSVTLSDLVSNRIIHEWFIIWLNCNSLGRYVLIFNSII
jgi:hypothetical protein